MIDSLREYDAFCQSCDCEVIFAGRLAELGYIPAKIVERDEADNRVYVQTHPRGGVFCMTTEQVRYPVAIKEMVTL